MSHPLVSVQADEKGMRQRITVKRSRPRDRDRRGCPKPLAFAGKAGHPPEQKL